HPGRTDRAWTHQYHEVLGLADGLLNARGERVSSAEPLRIGPHGHAVRLQGLTQRCDGGIVVRGMRQEDGDWHTVPSLALRGLFDRLGYPRTLTPTLSRREREQSTTEKTKLDRLLAIWWCHCNHSCGRGQYAVLSVWTPSGPPLSLQHAR